MISTRIRDLAPSPTLALDARVKQIQAAGTPVVNLCLGEPDFDTPRHIIDGAITALNEGFTHYTPTAGIVELRQAIASKLQQENGIKYDPSEIVVGVGSKPLLYNAFQVLCEKGADVLVPVPTWSSFVEQVKLAEGNPVFISLAAPFKLTAADIEKHLTPRTKILLLNSPSNPTGAMVDTEEIKKIAELAVKHNFWIIADEIYEKLTYTQSHTSIASFGEEVRQRTITINGFSKAYAMTGWRIGYAAGPKEVIKAMVDLQSQTTSCTSSFTQKAALLALTGPQDAVETMKQAFTKRRQFIFDAFSSIPGLSVSPPEGAFYLFVSVEKVLNDKYPTSQAWCEGLLNEKQVAVVPGEAFFAPGYFRLSYAASDQDLKTAAEKIAEFVQGK